MPRLIPDPEKSEAFVAFLEVAEAWGLSGNDRAILLRTATSSLSRWSNEPTRVGLDRDQYDRVHLLLNIHELLCQNFEDLAALNEFINARLPYSPFNYRSMLEYMLDDGGLQAIIKAERWLRNTIEQTQ